MELTEGEELVLDVSVHGRPTPEVEWIRNSDEIKNANCYSIKGNHQLRIPKVDKNHTGEYRCSAQNSSGRVSSALWLAVVPKTMKQTRASFSKNASNNIYFENPLSRPAVKEEPRTPGRRSTADTGSGTRRAPGFLSRPRPLAVKPGDHISLKASLLGHPPPKISWEKNGRLVTEDERISLVSEGKTHLLNILKATYSDSGSYKITARNPLGRQHATASVKVFDNAERLPSSEDEKSSTIHESQSQNRSYAVLGRVSSDNSSYMTVGNSTTIVRDYDADSNGSNRSIQSIRSSVKALSVTSRSDNSESQRSLPSAAPSSNQLVSPPSVIEPLETALCEVGDYVTLECQICGGVGDPEWRFNGSRELPNGAFHRKFGDIYRLRIRGIQDELFGEYSLSVFNTGGSQTVSCWVHNKNIPANQRPDRNTEPEQRPIEFIQYLKDATFIENCTLKLDAEIVGYPQPIVRWFFEDERFETSRENGIILTQEGVKYQLIVDNLNVDDSGTYTVVAQHPITSVTTESQCEVTVRPAQPRLTHVPTEVRVRSGQGFNLELEASCAKITWSFDEQEAEMIGFERFMFSVPNCDLGGKIRIFAENSAGVVEATTEVIIVDPPIEAPRIILHLPSEFESALDESLTLTMKYTGPATNITWTLNGSPLPRCVDVFSKCIAEGGYTQISIEHMSTECEGVLACEVSNKTVSKTSKCNISYTRVPPDFTSTPVENIAVTEGSPLVLGCEFTGVPPPKVVWLKDREPICNAVITENESLSKLEITSISPDDAGQYFVMLENVAGLAQYTMAVKVQPVHPREEGEPAKILEHLKDKTFIEQDDIVLRCRVHGKPIPTLAWYFQEELIWEGPPDEEGLTELILKDCWVEDMGRYSVRASNNFGSDESACYVKVHLRMRPKMEAQVPVEPMETIVEVSEHSRTTSADSHRTEQNESEWDDKWNETVTIESQSIKSIGRAPFFKEAADDVAQDSRPFKWKFNITDADELMMYRVVDDEEMPLEIDNTDFKLAKNDNEFLFSIKEVFPDDAGVYKLVASNHFGSTTQILTLTVDADGCEPRMMQRPLSTEVRIDEFCTFSAVVKGDPQPDVHWVMNKMDFLEGRTDDVTVINKIDSDHILSSSLRIMRFQEKYAGKAFFIARNNLAEVQAPFNINLAEAKQRPSADDNINQFDFRSQLKNKIDTKAFTSDDLRSTEAGQLDFRSNLKKSKTAENLADIVDEEVEISDELQRALARRLLRNQNVPSSSSESDDQRAQYVDVNSAASSSSKASTVQQVVSPSELSTTELCPSEFSPNELPPSELSPNETFPIEPPPIEPSPIEPSPIEPFPIEPPPIEFPPTESLSRPSFIQPLVDQSVKAGEPFKLFVVVDDAQEVFWTLEDEQIEAEPDEGLLLLQEDNTHTLSVASSMLEDMGTYEVIIKNSYGHTRSRAFVQILDG